MREGSIEDRIHEATRALRLVAEMARGLSDAEFLKSTEWNAVDAAEQALVDVLLDFESFEAPRIDPAVAVDLTDVGKLVLDELWQVGSGFPPGSGLLAGLGTYARPMGLWLGVVAWAFACDRDRAANLVQKALVFPTLETVTGFRHPLDGLLAKPKLGLGYFDLPLWAPEVITATAALLGQYPFTTPSEEALLLTDISPERRQAALMPDIDALLTEADNSLRNAGYGGAVALYRAASNRDPSRLEASLGEIAALCGAAINEEWKWGSPSPTELEFAVRRLRDVTGSAPALTMWRRLDAPRWHPEDDDPLLVAARDLSDLYRYAFAENKNNPARTDPDWPLRQFRVLFGNPEDLQPQVDAASQAVQDGLSAIYRLVETGINLSAKETTLAKIWRSDAEVVASAQERAACELEALFGQDWSTIGDPYRKHLIEAEALYQLFSELRQFSPNTVVQSLAVALEALLKDRLRVRSKRRLSMGDLASKLTVLGNVGSRFDISPEDQDIYRAGSADPQFWFVDVPTAMRGDIYKLRDAASHDVDRVTWDDAIRFHKLVLGVPEKPGLLVRIAARNSG